MNDPKRPPSPDDSANGSGATRAASSGPVVPAAATVDAESVAGEEDPGASVDLAIPPGGAPPHPGDLAAPGTPGIGEAVCPRCGGSDRLDAAPCPDCSGTGKVIQGIGGA